MDSASATIGKPRTGDVTAEQRPPRVRWPGEIAAVDRFVAFMLRRADNGGLLSFAIVKRLTRSKSILIRERLIVQNVSHGLEKLRKSDLVKEASVGDSRPLFEEMVDRGLNRFRTAQHAWHVLFYGDEIFELARRLPFADSILRAPLYWHSQLRSALGTDGNSDSAPAFFRVSVKPDQILDGNTRAELDVRLYHRGDLLDIVRVTISVTTARSGSVPGLPAHLEWPDDEDELPRIDAQAPVRGLTIQVSRALGGYQFEFLFARTDGDGKDLPDIVIPITREIGDDDLKKLLKRIRNFWTELAITNYAKSLSVTTSTFSGYADRLATLGQQAWLLLFGEGYGSQTGAGETLSSYLSEINLPQGTHIQISYPADLNNFVFPWNVLYPPPANDAAIDPLNFWGARFQIEQVFKGSKQDRLGEEPVNVAFALDSAFGNAGLETAMFHDYVASSNGKLSVTDPISNDTALEAGLRLIPAAHLVYFFCHGFAPSSPELRIDLVKVMREEIERLPDAEKAALDTLLRMFSAPGEEPWIHIGDSQIKESKLAGLKFFEQRKPIVFLNMCQSADLLPSMTSGLCTSVSEKKRVSRCRHRKSNDGCICARLCEADSGRPIQRQGRRHCVVECAPVFPVERRTQSVGTGLYALRACHRQTWSRADRPKLSSRVKSHHTRTIIYLQEDSHARSGRNIRCRESTQREGRGIARVAVGNAREGNREESGAQRRCRFSSGVRQQYDGCLGQREIAGAARSQALEQRAIRRDLRRQAGGRRRAQQNHDRSEPGSRCGGNRDRSDANRVASCSRSARCGAGTHPRQTVAGAGERGDVCRMAREHQQHHLTAWPSRRLRAAALALSVRRLGGQPALVTRHVVVIQQTDHAWSVANRPPATGSPERLNRFVPNALMVPLTVVVRDELRNRAAKVHSGLPSRPHRHAKERRPGPAEDWIVCSRRRAGAAKVDSFRSNRANGNC